MWEPKSIQWSTGSPVWFYLVTRARKVDYQVKKKYKRRGGNRHSWGTEQKKRAFDSELISPQRISIECLISTAKDKYLNVEADDVVATTDLTGSSCISPSEEAGANCNLKLHCKRRAVGNFVGNLTFAAADGAIPALTLRWNWSLSLCCWRSLTAGISSPWDCCCAAVASSYRDIRAINGNGYMKTKSGGRWQNKFILLWNYLFQKFVIASYGCFEIGSYYLKYSNIN